MTVRKWKDAGICLLFLSLATVTSAFFFVRPNYNTANVAIIYMLATFLISRYTEGYWWGFLASLAGVIAVNFFFTYPYFALDFFRVGYPLTFLSMFTVSMITSMMTTRVNRQKQASMEREEMLEKLNQFSDRLIRAKTEEEMLRLSLTYLSELNHASVLFRPDAGPQDQSEWPVYYYGDDTAAVFDPVQIRTIDIARGEDGISGSFETALHHYHYLPVSSPEHRWGILFFCTGKDTRKAFTFDLNRLMIPQIALSLDHYALADHHHRLILETEKEKMRSNLLRAVSHDLRTPLTGMIGASSTYLEAKQYLDEDYKDRLIQGIYDDANWLLHMVENLLSVTRISHGTANVTKTSESLEEVVSEAVVRFQKRYPSCETLVRIPDEFLMVPMDATLIEQVIINLLENALVHAYSSHPTELTVRKRGQEVIFSVKDYGKGIDPDRLDSIFDGSPASDSDRNDSRKGMGIGLSICKTIILAHHGQIEARNHPSGAEFWFSLPLEQDA